ncbi:MAG: type III-A CRISPR-associated RAMP protein Csm3 [Calditrichaceae bacterium]|nr:type III-A CRISPR-associated RAMP protein Csm3 [Calditrichaceae bacterium]
MRLQKIIEIKGTIKVLTGLHIGMGNQEIHIGGMDNPVIKHPVTKEPYIPGSSLKGKMRTLLEYYLGKVDKGGAPWTPDSAEAVKKDPICRIFGSANTKFPAGPTRLIVRDGFLTGEYKKRIEDENDEFTVYDVLEGKWENSINRQTGTALNPRQTERVVAGAEFTLHLIYRVFDEEDEKNFEKYVLKALELVQNDALGGSGSRGYGKVEFNYEKPEHKVFNHANI